MLPSTSGRWPVLLPAIFLALALAGCGGGPHQAMRWDGRRGYDGHGDYGYNCRIAVNRETRTVGVEYCT